MPGQQSDQHRKEEEPGAEGQPAGRTREKSAMGRDGTVGGVRDSGKERDPAVERKRHACGTAAGGQGGEEGGRAGGAMALGVDPLDRVRKLGFGNPAFLRPAFLRGNKVHPPAGQAADPSDPAAAEPAGTVIDQAELAGRQHRRLRW